MARGGSVRVCHTAVLCGGFYLAQPAFAADLQGARLEVTRDPGAASCPDAQTLADTLHERLGPGRVVEAATLVIEVEVRSTGTGFAATVHASGAKRGVRSLSAAGPTCDGLREALVVSLLILLDRDAQRPEFGEREAKETEGRPLSFWLGGGAALTPGLPDDLSVALLGEAGARYGPHSLWLGAVFIPERDIPFDPGFVSVSAKGGQLRACTLLFGAGALRTDACVLGQLLALRAAAHDYPINNHEVRPLWLAGAGAELAFVPVPWFTAAVCGRLLISPKQEVFSIKGLEPAAYESKPAVGWLGLSLAAKIW